MSADRTRRNLVLAAPALLLGGCTAFDALPREGAARGLLEGVNRWTHAVQRRLMGDALAREYTRAEIRQPMRPNGVIRPTDADYLALEAAGWRDWRLAVTGLVARPLSLSLADLRAMPARTQVTRHDCVEGWSCIAEWTGVPLSLVLDRAGLLPGARFVYFRSMDTIERSLAGSVRYWESLDMAEARHAQTILAWGMNGADLPVANGAPLRLRVERQLGYKMAKYLRGIEVVGALSDKGGYWEERGYDWWAGI
jgi:DMSO/TMAO reductase YedYZ molybdopterin-dependent catalytic subunit